jgi:hypothetical protein
VGHATLDVTVEPGIEQSVEMLVRLIADGEVGIALVVLGNDGRKAGNAERAGKLEVVEGGLAHFIGLENGREGIPINAEIPGKRGERRGLGDVGVVGIERAL